MSDPEVAGLIPSSLWEILNIVGYSCDTCDDRCGSVGVIDGVVADVVA
ncbi:MAG: hypothetical protein NTX81_01820 [Candidatus Bathyarchaeota archaeon]|nr:hypothetical protein [Candidatus Bathyarchaeota archaeon]